MNSQSELDFDIPPEIIDDQLFGVLKNLASLPYVKTILEIGSSSGEGSTKALYEGKSEDALLFCLEVSRPRFQKLQERYRDFPGVECFNMFSMDTIFEFPREDEVEKFYKEIPTKLNKYPLERVIGWLRQDIWYILENGIWGCGISYIKDLFKIKDFDLVLIDGSEFTGYVDFKRVYGSGILVLDDICTFKNFRTYHELLKDPNYILIEENKMLRGGFAVFEKRFKKEIE